MSMEQNIESRKRPTNTLSIDFGKSCKDNIWWEKKDSIYKTVDQKKYLCIKGT